MLEARLSASKPWATAGHVIAWEQFAARCPARPQSPEINASTRCKVNVEPSTGTIAVGNGLFQATFSKTTGLLERHVCLGIPVIVAPLKPNFWRAMTDNDLRGVPNYRFALGFFEPSFIAQEGKLASIDARVNDDGTATVTTVLRLPNGRDGDFNGEPGDFSDYVLTHDINGSGDMRVTARFESKHAMPRFGMQCGVPLRFSHRMAYFGRGPHEAYCDRRESTVVGIFEGPVDSFQTSYVFPQENGNRVDIKWLVLEDEHGRGIKFSGCPLFDGSAWTCTQEDLDDAKHTNELPRRDYLTVNVDHKQAGVGGYDTWSHRAHPLPEHCIQPGVQSYTFEIAFVRNKGKPRAW